MLSASFVRRLAVLALVAVGAALVLMGYVPGNDAGPVRTLPAARRQADRFGEALALHAGEVMQFSNGFYAELLDADGRRATEVLVDPGSGAVWTQYGPAMMWNTRYGMMGDYSVRGGPMMGGGMMGGGMMGPGGMMAAPRGGRGMMGGRFRGDPTWAPSGGGTQKPAISATRAEQIAESWLGENTPGLSAGETDAFPGYYTLHTRRNGRHRNALGQRLHRSRLVPLVARALCAHDGLTSRLRARLRVMRDWDGRRR